MLADEGDVCMVELACVHERPKEKQLYIDGTSDMIAPRVRVIDEVLLWTVLGARDEILLSQSVPHIGL